MTVKPKSSHYHDPSPPVRCQVCLSWSWKQSLKNGMELTTFWGYSRCVPVGSPRASLWKGLGPMPWRMYAVHSVTQLLCLACLCTPLLHWCTGNTRALPSAGLCAVYLPLRQPKLHTCLHSYLLNSQAAAAAKLLQSCPTLCEPRDGSSPGSPVPGILQARTLEWVAISFSNAWKWKVKVNSLSHVRLLVTPWTAAHQALPSMGFSRQECWSGVPLPPYKYQI